MPIFRLFCPKMVTFQAAILQKLIFLCKTKSECSKSRKKSPIWQKNQQNGALFHILPNLMKFHVFANFRMFQTLNRHANYLKCSEFCLHCVCYSLIFNENPKNCISELLIFYQITRAGPTVYAQWAQNLIIW